MKIELMMMLFVGIVLPSLTLFFGLYLLKKKQRREKRINRVVSLMMSGFADITTLLHRLFLSGIEYLEDGKEISEACNRIEARGGGNPIPDDSGLSLDDLKPFFTYVSAYEIYLSQTPIQKVIKTYKNEMVLKMAA